MVLEVDRYWVFIGDIMTIVWSINKPEGDVKMV